MSARFLRAITTALVALLAFLLLGVLGGTTPAWAAGTLGLTQELSYGGSAGTDFDVPSGSSLVLSLTYNCNGEDCVDSTITAPIPAGLSIGAISVVSGASSSVTANTVTITLPSMIPGGSAGQITIGLTVPSWTTENGAIFAWQSTMQATGSTTTTSNEVSVTARAASVASGELFLTSGGTLDEPVVYRAEVCVSPEPGASAVAVAADSTVVVSLPAGAVFVAADNGGVAGSGTITWTLGQLAGCSHLNYTVTYPSSDVNNTIGSVKTTSLLWEGQFLGEPPEILATAEHSHELVEPTVEGTFNKWSHATTAATTTSVTWFLAFSNTGNTTADEVTIDDTIPDHFQVTSVSASMPSVGITPGEVWIASRWGQDGVPGNGDDGELVKAADLPIDGSNVGINMYGAGSWPSGASQLVDGDLVVRVVVELFDIGPGQGGDRAAITGKIMESSFDGTTPTEVGDTITNAARYTFHVESGSVDETVIEDRSHTITVIPQVTDIAPKLNGGGTLAPGVTAFNATVSAFASPFPLKNPVIVLLLPAMVDLTSWTPSSTIVLPTPTLNTFPGWNGTTSTLYRWTYPVDTVLAPNTNYSIDYVLELDEEAWGTSTMRAHVSSSSEPYTCNQNFFGSDPDTEDRDGDGNTSEVLCNWNESVSPAPSTSAALTIQVDGAYSGGFATGTVYTAPGSSDTYRVAMRNTGTLPLNGVVVVATLPRPGDTAILTSSSRNSNANTFPVVLEGAATAPTLDSDVTVFYSTVANPCLPELASSPAGCAPPGWATTLPEDPATVTAIKVEYGENTLNPFTTWAVDLPVTTPTTGATEAEYASINTDPSAPEDDERAAGSAAFAAITQSSTTLAAESAFVTLRMPNVDGGEGIPPTASDLTSTGTGTDQQSVEVHVPTGGEVRLLDGGTETTTLTIPGEGVYTIDPDTGVITFEPVLGFAGSATAVSYLARNALGETATASYTPTVLTPEGPTAPDLTSSASPDTRTQTATIVIPTSGSATLLDDDNPVLTVTVPGQGKYELDPATGVVVFTPLPGFSGTPTPVAYRITDAYGQTDDATYAPGAVPAPVIIDIGGLAMTGHDMTRALTAALLAVGGGVALVAIRRRFSAVASLELRHGRFNSP